MRTKTCNGVLRPNEEMGVGEEHHSSFSVTFFFLQLESHFLLDDEGRNQ